MQRIDPRWLVLMLLSAACHASSLAAHPMREALAPQGTGDARAIDDATASPTRESPTTADARAAASAAAHPTGESPTTGAAADARAADRAAAHPTGETPTTGAAADARAADSSPAGPNATAGSAAARAASIPPAVPLPAPLSAGVRRAKPHRGTLVAASDTVKRRISGVATIAGAPRAGVTVKLGNASAQTGADGRYALATDTESGLPSATLDGWAFEAHPADNGEVNFAAVGVTLSGELPASVTATPTVTDGVRKAVATRDAPGKRWKWKLELTPAGPLELSATAQGFKLILDPELSRVPLVVARRDKTGLNFIRVCDLEGTLVLGAASDGAPMPPPITAVVSLDVKPRFWVQEPATHQMSQVNKQFKPQLLVVRVGDTVEFVNEEPDTQMQHQVTADEPNPKKFDASTRGVTGRQVFSTLGVTPIHCAIHSSMHADVIVVKTPFAATTDAQGHWRIADVPEGSWGLVALEPNGGTAEQASVKACGPPVAVRLRQKPPKPVACRPDEYECLSPVP